LNSGKLQLAVQGYHFQVKARSDVAEPQGTGDYALLAQVSPVPGKQNSSVSIAVLAGATELVGHQPY
jgi:hypothetical protein